MFLSSEPLVKEPSQEETKKAIGNLKTNKTPGEDDIIAVLIKKASRETKKSRILQRMQHTQGDTKERELLKRVVAVKECIRGGGSHLQDIIFKQ